MIELQGQETDSSPVDEKIPVSEHGSTSFLFFYSDDILSWETAKFEKDGRKMLDFNRHFLRNAIMSILREVCYPFQQMQLYGIFTDDTLPGVF